MRRLLYVISECYVDTNLISTLLNANVNHQKGCSTVASIMQRKFNNGIAIGIIDNDKHCPSYLNEMDLLCKSEHLAVYKHRYMCHYIITIIPAVDTFILECAKEAGVNVRDFGFSSNLKEFTKCTKKVTSNINPIFTRLFSILEDSSEFGLLKQVLTYLIENKYQSTNDSLKQFFDVR